MGPDETNDKPCFQTGLANGVMLRPRGGSCSNVRPGTARFAGGRLDMPLSQF
jgi:hypothetical protein